MTVPVKCSKKEVGNEITADCGCVFRCEPFYWGRIWESDKFGVMRKKEPTAYYYFRIEDCDELKRIVRVAIEEACGRAKCEV